VSSTWLPYAKLQKICGKSWRLPTKEQKMWKEHERKIWSKNMKNVHNNVKWKQIWCVKRFTLVTLDNKFYTEEFGGGGGGGGWGRR